MSKNKKNPFKDLKPMNYRGYTTFINTEKGVAPYFVNAIAERIHKKFATNIVVTGEAGIGKSYFALNLARLIDKTFSIDQVVFDYDAFMDLVIGLKMGKPIVFDEPSYAIGKHEWYKQLNRALVKTIESFRFRIHPLIIPVINMNLLDKTVRRYLIQFAVHLYDRGKGIVYNIYPSQWKDDYYRYHFCNVDYKLFDTHLCDKDTCLGCKKLQRDCMIFRAQYERKKETIQLARYRKDKTEAAKDEARKISTKDLEDMAYALREDFVDRNTGKIDNIKLMTVMEDTHGIMISQWKARQIRKRLELHHPNEFTT